MWWPSAQLSIWLYRRPTDMRKSYDGLTALVKNAVKADPLNGSLYVFVNRRRTQMKCLYYEAGGYCIWAKRLERGQFQVQWQGAETVRLDMSTLRLLVEGIEPQTVHRFRRYKRPEEAVIRL